MRSLCARLYNGIGEKRRALCLYLGTAVTSYPASGEKSPHAQFVSSGPSFAERLGWGWFHPPHQAAVTTALGPAAFSWGPL